MKKISNSRLRLYGISRAELAAALYVSPRTLTSRMANTDTLTLGELRIIARKLHCSIAVKSRPRSASDSGSMTPAKSVKTFRYLMA